MISTEHFWDRFATRLHSDIQKDRAEQIRLFRQNKEWTDYIRDKVLFKIGAQLGFKDVDGIRGITTEWCRVDVGYFSPTARPVEGVNENWDWDVAIEHENGQGLEWISELVKLRHISCGLRVIITYHKDGETNSIPEKLRIGESFLRLSKYPASGQFLVIFGPHCNDVADFDFEAHQLINGEFAQMTERPIWRKER